MSKIMYEYQCADEECKHIFDWIVDSEDEKVVCEKCGAPTKRLRISISKHGRHSSWPVK